MAASRLRSLLSAATLFEPSVLEPEVVRDLAARRGAAQLEVVDAFLRATRRYDDGHRPFAATTFDVMLDDVLPAYGSTALLRVLRRFAQVGYLAHDELDALFAPALARPETARDAARVIALLEAYVAEAAEREPRRVASCLRSVRRHLPAATRTALERRLANARAIGTRRAALERQLARITPRQLLALIASDEALALCHDHPSAQAFADRMLRGLRGVPPAALENLVARALARPRTYVLTAALAYLVVRDPRGAGAAAGRLAAAGREARGALADALTDLARWTVKPERGADDPIARIARSPAARRALRRAIGVVAALDRRVRRGEAAASLRAFERADPVALVEAIAREGHVVAYEHPATAAFGAAVERHLTALPASCFVAMADRCLERDPSRGLPAALAYLFARDARAARAYVLERGFTGELRGPLGSALQELARDDPPSPEMLRYRPWLGVVARPVLARAIRGTIAALRPAYATPLDRARRL
jgi:hypothetical protein